MAANVFQITVPTDCSTLVMEETLPTSFCQSLVKRSEIDCIIFQGADDGPTDMSSGSAWTGLIDNTDTTGDKMKYLIGIGTIGEPEDTVQTGARDAEQVTERIRTLVFTVNTISATSTYDFLRTLQTGALTPKFYYTSIGGWLYGKVGASTAVDNGITPLSVKVTFPKEAGKEATDKAIITIRYSSIVEPDRVVNPLTLT